MRDFIIVTDTCSDLPLELVEKMELPTIPLSVEVEGKSYFHYPDERELPATKLYQLLRDKKVARTSQVNPEEFLTFFEPLLQKNHDILYIGFSSALSGTFHSSTIAAAELTEKYPERTIICIDSLCASTGLGLLVMEAWNLQQKGKTLQQVSDWVEEQKLQLCHLFTVDDLGTLQRGGRLSSSAAFLGSLLRIKPILHVSNEGKLVPVKKAKGRKTALNTLVELMDGKITTPKKQSVFISHGDCIEEAQEVGTMIQERYGVKEIFYNQIGPIIGAHSGPGTIAIFFFGNER